MFVDLCVLFIAVTAIWKGMRKGLVLALFSFAGVFVGIAAALKMSTLVSRWLASSVHVNASWLPFLAFVVIMLGVALLVRLGAGMIEAVLDLTMLSWVNKLAGCIFYFLLYCLLFSIVVFYAEKMQWLTISTIQSSKTYPWLHSVGPLAIEGFGKLIPIFKGMFDELSRFFDMLNKDLSMA